MTLFRVMFARFCSFDKMPELVAGIGIGLSGVPRSAGDRRLPGVALRRRPRLGYELPLPAFAGRQNARRSGGDIIRWLNTTRRNASGRRPRRKPQPSTRRRASRSRSQAQFLTALQGAHPHQCSSHCSRRAIAKRRLPTAPMRAKNSSILGWEAAPARHAGIA